MNGGCGSSAAPFANWGRVVIYEFKSAVREWNPGDTVTTEELAAAGADIPFLLERKAIQPVGFLAPNEARTDEQQAALVAELHAKIEEGEKEADKLREEIREQRKRIAVLEQGHKVGSQQLAAALQEVAQLKALLALADEEAKARQPVGAK